MRQFVFALISLLFISCTKGGDDNPTPPLPPQTGTGSNQNLGKIVLLADSLKVYDANTGNLIVLSNPYGVAFNSYNVNTTVSDSLVYQVTFTSLLAMDINKGTRRFIKIFSPAAYSWGGVSKCYPVVDGINIYVGAFNFSGQFKLWCVNKLNGETVWESAESLTFDSDAEFMPSLAQTDKAIIVNTYDGPASFEKATGKLIWRNSQLPEYKKLSAKIRISNGKMYCVSYANREVFAFDVNTGKNVWRRPLDNTMRVIGEMEVYNNALNVVQGKLSGNDYLGLTVLSIDVNTGQIIKTFQLPTATHWIYFYENSFYSFNTPNKTILPTRINKHDLNTGTILWSTDLEGVIQTLLPTPNYLYFSELAPNISDWRKIRILSPLTGKTVKDFFYTGHEIRPVVIDSSNKVYYPVR